MLKEIYQTYLNEKRGDWSKTTIRTTERILRHIPDFREWTTNNFFDYFDERQLKPTTIQTYISIIKNFSKWKYGKRHPASKLHVKRKKAPPQRALTLEQLEILLCSFDTYSTKGIRDLAMAALMVDSGLRAAEVCSLETGQLDLDMYQLSVVTKGGEWQTAIFSEWTAQYLNNWLNVRKTKCNNVFISFQAANYRLPITPGGLNHIIKSWGEKAQIPLKGPHDLRRTFATISTKMGAPTRVLQVAGRWSNIDLVERYTSRIKQDDFEPYFPMRAIMHAR